MYEKAEILSIEELLQKSLEGYRCPYCNDHNPVVRYHEAYQTPRGTMIIFSCMKCKRILNCALAQTN